jgi:hypothetical protein
MKAFNHPDALDFDEPFWLVACTQVMPSGPLDRAQFRLIGAPRFVHESRISAEREALRLAQLNIGYRFAVLGAEATVCADASLGAPRWTDLGAQ